MKQLSYEMKKMLTALLLLCGFSTSAQEAKTHTGLCGRQRLKQRRKMETKMQ